MLKRGINIGDHFENTPVPGEKFENPIQDYYFDLIPKLGFDHVRLPVKWSAHTDDENGYKIAPYFLEMVEDTIKKFIDKGLSVILNIHHFREAMDNPKENEEKILAIWGQLAPHFKDYPDNLIFEVMNEPTWRTTAEEWNEVQDKAVALIRETNPTRLIEICGIDYSGLFAMEKLVPPANDKNLIGTFHYYFPLDFTHQGAYWSPTYKDIRGITWEGTKEQYDDIYDGIKRAAVAWRDKYGLPLNLGEFGAYGKYCDMESRAKYTKAVRSICEELDISWTYWELNRNFGICTPEGKLFPELVDALLKD